MEHISLLEHIIFKSYQNDLNLITRIILASKRNKKKAQFNEKQILINNLFNFLVEIENKQKDIQIAKSFLKTPNTIGRKNKKIKTRGDYIKYHIEFYQISIVGIFDRLLHLINFIYKLGLADRYVTKDIICTNTKIPKNVIFLIKELDKTIDPVRRSQNIIKHKEKIYLPELYNADLLDFTLNQWSEIKAKKIKVSFSWTDEDEIDLRKDADFFYQTFLKKEHQKIDNISDDLNKYIIKFLDILNLEFKKQI